MKKTILVAFCLIFLIFLIAVVNDQFLNDSSTKPDNEKPNISNTDITYIRKPIETERHLNYVKLYCFENVLYWKYESNIMPFYKPNGKIMSCEEYEKTRYVHK